MTQISERSANFGGQRLVGPDPLFSRPIFADDSGADIRLCRDFPGNWADHSILFRFANRLGSTALVRKTPIF